MRTVLITGSTGLIGSEAALFFDARGWRVIGVDNNMRREFFGPDGDTTPVLRRLTTTCRRYTHHAVDVRARDLLRDLLRQDPPALIVHCAGQPSHDLAKSRPFDDFEVNAVGTLNLLEAARHHCPESPFIFMSTNKVYGDAPNRRPVRELPTRYEYVDPNDWRGITEECPVDASLHSLFGASKLAADVLVQEYGRYFGMPTVCFRAGCVTGSRQASAELHGFLGYLARATREGRLYRIFGYRGKQVRDTLHAYDARLAFLAFFEHPRSAAVYNLGGGRANSLSVLEAIECVEARLGKRLHTQYVDQARLGDHICYITDCSRFQRDYPSWTVTHSIEQIVAELTMTNVPLQ